MANEPNSVTPRTTFDEVRHAMINAPKQWCVTGAAGFIGSNLVELLLQLGQRVVGLDNYSTGSRANISDAVIPETADRFRMIEGDIRDLGACRDACSEADYVLHQAALGSVPRSIDDPVTSNQVNVDGFLNMLVAAKDAHVKRFVFASSSSVYGDSTNLPQTEERTGNLLSPYAVTKATNESYAIVFQKTYALEVIGLRYFNVFGPRQDPQGAYAAVIPRWVSNLLHEQPCRIFGDGETSRDFCYVANVMQANLLAATVDPSGTGQCYNIACGETTSLNRLFYMMRDGLAAFNPAIAAAEPTYEAFRRGDIAHSYARIDRARQNLGYAPTHRLPDGLREALGWYVRSLNSPRAAEV
jgi:UDP-N-acetylglucosamine/UDP-N-acetylgalactosamine 4-epimerase